MALTVITGPPASGKNTWLDAHAKTGDIVIDYDAITQSLSVRGDTHNHPRILAKVGYRARTAAINEALRHVNDVDVWIIHSDPQPDALQRYAEHGAHIVTINPGRDVVMRRIAEERPASARAVATRWYNRHGDTADSETTSEATTTTTSRAW
jgi:hypothetical protein